MLVKLPFFVLLVLFLQKVPITYQRDTCPEKLKNCTESVKNIRNEYALACKKEKQDLENRYKQQLELLKNTPSRSKTPDCEQHVEQYRRGLSECETKLGRCSNQLGVNQTCCIDAQRYKTELDNQRRTHGEELKRLSENSRRDYAALLGQYQSKTDDFDKLAGRNTELQAAVRNLENSSGNKSAEERAVFEKSKNLEKEIQQINAAQKATSESIAAYQAETLRTMIATDEVSIENPNEATKKYKNTSAQYKTVIEDGVRYQVRELMIGSLYFPDQSDLSIEPKKEKKIEVIFKPNALLKNSAADGNTKWYLEFNFTPDKIKGFDYDKISSGGERRRLITDAPNYRWIWKAEDGKIPSGFSTDTPRIRIDGSVEIAGQELVKKIIADDDLKLTEKILPGLFARVFGFVKDNLTALLLITTAIFGVGTAYLGLDKAKIEREMKRKENEEKIFEGAGTSGANSGANPESPTASGSPPKEK